MAQPEQEAGWGWGQGAALHCRAAWGTDCGGYISSFASLKLQLPCGLPAGVQGHGANGRPSELEGLAHYTAQAGRGVESLGEAAPLVCWGAEGGWGAAPRGPSWSQPFAWHCVSTATSHSPGLVALPTWLPEGWTVAPSPWLKASDKMVPGALLPTSPSPPHVQWTGPKTINLLASSNGSLQCPHFRRRWQQSHAPLFLSGIQALPCLQTS